jgi:ParB family chromosome partitioning protein
MLRPPAARGKADAESANVRALVSRLERRLGTRCRVVQRTAQAGRLEIDYGTLVELDGILEKMGA